MQGEKWAAVLAGTGLMLLAGCAANETRDAEVDNGAAAAAEVSDPDVVITVPDRFAYHEDATVSEAIRRECELEERFPGFVQEFGARHDVRVDTDPEASPQNAGKVLFVEITQARNDGNAWAGHRSLAEAGGTLYEDGEAVAEFTSRRVSGGGAFGGFKGSCAVMGRTIRAMGADIAAWARLPEDGAHLGN